MDRATTTTAAGDEERPNAAQRAPGTLRGGELLRQVKLAWDEGLVRVLLHLSILTMKLESCICKCCVSYAFSGCDRRQGIDM